MYGFTRCQGQAIAAFASAGQRTAERVGLGLSIRSQNLVTQSRSALTSRTRVHSLSISLDGLATGEPQSLASVRTTELGEHRKVADVEGQQPSVEKECGGRDREVGAVDTSVGGQPSPAELTGLVSNGRVDVVPAQRRQEQLGWLELSVSHAGQYFEARDLAAVQGSLGSLAREQRGCIGMPSEMINEDRGVDESGHELSFSRRPDLI